MESRWRAIINTRNHYGWLAITGDENKESYALAIRAGVNSCFCCEFVRGNGGCDNCPLNGYAWKQSDDVQCHGDRNSVYKMWHRAKTKEDRQYWAMRMVRACDKALEDLIFKGEMKGKATKGLLQERFYLC